jgi:hypothetical protein
MGSPNIQLDTPRWAWHLPSKVLTLVGELGTPLV